MPILHKSTELGLSMLWSERALGLCLDVEKGFGCEILGVGWNAVFVTH